MNTIELSDLISITMLSFFENLAEIFSKANVKINDARNITEIFNVLVTLDQDSDNVKNAIKLLQDYPAAISLILSIPKEIDIVFRELCYDNYEKAREVSDNLVDVMKRDMVKDREQLINDESCCESDIDNESKSSDFEFKQIDALFRIDDGVKFSINSDGTYSMCDSGMANPYRYTYGELMSTGCFSVCPQDIESNEDICCDNPEDPIEELDKLKLSPAKIQKGN
jgi:hypothetical protein